MDEDASLLRRYADEKSEAAFAELVRRHLGLVYAAALRRLGGDSHGAADVAQQVFVKLARHAATLSRHEALAAWLYAATRNASVDWMRFEHRRKAREQAAAAMSEWPLSAPAPTADWAQLEPLLDQMLDQLDERDRTALLLRFFEGRPFAEIGAALNVSEDGARMRVDRALEKLHRLLAGRGISSPAAALGLVLQQQAGAATVILPGGLLSGITSAALAQAGVTAALGSSLSLLFSMSLRKITVSVVALAAVAGLGTAFYVQSSAPAQKPASLASPVAAAVPAPAKPVENAELKALREENKRLRDLVDHITTTSGSSVPEKVARLRAMITSVPEQGIPEFSLLTDDDWYAAVDGPLETSDDYRVALSKLRGRAESRFASLAVPALRAFQQANSGEFPKTPADLKSFAEGKVEEAVWNRYKVAPAKEIPNVRMGGDWIITQSSVIDSEYDSRFVIGPNGSGAYRSDNHDSALLDPLFQAFIAANPGVSPNNPSLLLPYAKTPEQRRAVERLLNRMTRR